MTLAMDVTSLWMWPMTLAKANLAAFETMAAIPDVLGARLPMIAEAVANPLTARTSELNRMVTEKSDAARLSHRAITTTTNTVRKAAEGNARDAERLSGGAFLWPTDYLRMAERNMAAFAALARLPGEAMAPIHARVTSNARRLRG